MNKKRNEAGITRWKERRSVIFKNFKLDFWQSIMNVRTVGKESVLL